MVRPGELLPQAAVRRDASQQQQGALRGPCSGLRSCCCCRRRHLDDQITARSTTASGSAAAAFSSCKDAVALKEILLKVLTPLHWQHTLYRDQPTPPARRACWVGQLASQRPNSLSACDRELRRCYCAPWLDKGNV